jgi:hypothetical protein
LRKFSAILILCFYTTSIWGYSFLEVTHQFLHQIPNPFHHHAVSHHHGFTDHDHTSKSTDQQNPSQKISTKIFYFFSYLQIDTGFDFASDVHEPVSAGFINLSFVPIYLTIFSPPPLG